MPKTRAQAAPPRIRARPGWLNTLQVCFLEEFHHPDWHLAIPVRVILLYTARRLVADALPRSM
ncbi:MAG: hypothetical protein ACREFP_01325, partial [Acetobacteraceae bacterium]